MVQLARLLEKVLRIRGLMKSDRMNEIAVVTRLHYDFGDAKFLPRVGMYEEYALKSLLNQTDPHFDIWVWAEEHHRKTIEKIHPRIKVFTADWVRRGSPHKTKFWIDYTPFSKVKGLPKYTTVVSLDSDDELDPHGISNIRWHSTGDVNKAISFQPIKRDLTTGKRYRMKSYELRKKMAPIFALYQPNDPYLFIYEYGHYSKMPEKFAGNIVYIDEGKTYMNIHDFNESTSVISEDVEIK